MATVGCSIGLHALGMEPGDITHLIVSHLHFDHCGGIVRRRESGALEAAFPRRESDRAARRARARRQFAQRAAARGLPACRGILAPVRPLIEAIDGDADVIAGVRAVVTGGHTAGPSSNAGQRRRRMLHPSGRYRADAIAYAWPVEPGVRSRCDPHDGAEGALPRTRAWSIAGGCRSRTTTRFSRRWCKTTADELCWRDRCARCRTSVSSVTRREKSIHFACLATTPIDTQHA
jgi:hypothetical protein